MTAVARLAAFSLDCDDPIALADFYHRLTEWPIAFSADNFVALSGGSVWLTLQKVDAYVPPSWPDAAVPKQAHLEFAAADLDSAQEAVEKLGATSAAVQSNPDTWRVMLDPAGHPFCLTTLIPE
jgi:hypothetical protein